MGYVYRYGGLMINLHLLRQFMVVAEEHSFSRAADVLFISQPAVSKAVQELERSLGITLLDRSGRQIRLTYAGETLVSYARTMFATEQAAERALVQLKTLEKGQLAIGASSTIGTYMLPPLLGRFQQRFPGIRLMLEIGNTPLIAQKLLRGDLDTAIVEGLTEETAFTVRHWRDDELVVITSPARAARLAAGGVITEGQFNAEPFIVREAASGTRQIIEKALLQRDLKPPIALELGSTEAIKQAVMADLGITIVSSAAIQLEVRGGYLSVIQLADLEFRRPLLQIGVRDRPTSRTHEMFDKLLYGDV
jgi:DNA-binding transcriptional LysR family regulator